MFSLVEDDSAVSKLQREDASVITAEQRRIIDELATALKEKIAELEIDDNTRYQLNKVIYDLEQDFLEVSHWHNSQFSILPYN